MPRQIEGLDLGFEFGAAGLSIGTDGKGRVQSEPDPFDPIQDWSTEELDYYKLGNEDLPIFAFKEEIVETIANNPVTIIVAETGAGKSTQVPQFLAETFGYDHVYVTQPRRPAAKGVFERVRHEVTEKRGVYAGEDLASFQTAVDKQGPEHAMVRVKTDGLQLVHELHMKGTLENDVLIIDEVHEWNSNVELLVAWSKKAIEENPSMHVVLMSATMDAENLASYYESVCEEKPPIINVPGRNYPVEWIEKPDSTVVDEVIRLVQTMQNIKDKVPDTPRGILVFEPGKREIQEAIDEINRRTPIEMRDQVKIFPLHAKLSTEEQDAAIEEYPGFIKIVVATDIAEASITIPDVKYVVDSGLKRQPNLDDEGTKGLSTIQASRANCMQHAGRVGRVSAGVYILTKMDQKSEFMPFKARESYPLAEILRTDVQRNVLRLKAIGIEMREFDMYHKASQHILELADVQLNMHGAIDDDGRITTMGHTMNQYPLCTSSARIMVESLGYPRPIRAYLAAITASKEQGTLQYYAHNAGSEWRDLTDETSSDLLVQLDLFIATQGMSDAELKRLGMDISNVRRAQEQYVKIARLAGASGAPLVPPTEEERELIKECSLVGFIPSIYVHEGEGKYKNISNPHANIQREITNRSVITGNPPIVIGDPWRVERFDDDGPRVEHLIDNVSTPSLQQIGKVAAQHVTWHFDDYELRDGKYYQRERSFLLDSIDLKTEPRLMPPEPSPRLRATIIEHAIEKPGAEQRRLRELKNQVEYFSHRAKDPVPLFTQDMLLELVHEAAPPDITNPAIIEDNLRLMALDPERRLHLDDFVSPERRKLIEETAPHTIQIGDQMMSVNYHNRKPLVRVYDPSFLLGTDDVSISLEDGREVRFIYHNDDGHPRQYTLSQLRNRILFD